MKSINLVKNIGKREKNRQKLIEAAEQLMAANGLVSLKARELAAHAGIAVGQIYNLVGDMDELVLRVNSRTIARLEQCLEQFLKSVKRFSDKNCGKTQELEHFVEPSETKNALEQESALHDAKSVQTRLIAIAIAYHHFARENYHLWHAMFDHQPRQEHKEFSRQVSDERLRPFRLIEQLLAPLCPTMSGQEIKIFAQSVFSSVHGIILLALDARDVGVPETQLDAQLRLHLTLLCYGLADYKGSQ